MKPLMRDRIGQLIGKLLIYIFLFSHLAAFVALVDIIIYYFILVIT